VLRYAVVRVGCEVRIGHRPAIVLAIRRAGNRWRVYICTYQVPGGLRSHREQITQELAAIYRPTCNEQEYERSWKDEWIGEYRAPTTGPLTTGRDPGDGLPPAGR